MFSIRGKRGYEAATVEPMLSKLDAELEGIFKKMDEETYNLADQGY